MLISATFHEAMKNAVPHIVERLKDSHSHVESAAANTFEKLTERGR
jgi:hypothetical protein